MWRRVRGRGQLLMLTKYAEYNNDLKRCTTTAKITVHAKGWMAEDLSLHQLVLTMDTTQKKTS